MKLKRILIQRFFSLLSVFVLTGALSACINDSSECPDPKVESDLVTFSFQMVSTNIGSTRALDASGHDDTVSEWPAFEDTIIEGDFAFYIFAQDAEKVWKMIMSMTDLRNNKNAYMTVKGISGVWMITAAIPKDELENTLGYKIKSGPEQKIKLRVAVIANGTGGNTAATSRVNYASLIKPTFTEFINEANDILFNLGSIHSGNEGDSSVDGIYKGAIPMYGMNEFTVSGDQLYYSKQHDPAWIGNVDLLRALAKVRVIDNIESKKPETGFPRIESAEVFSATARSYILPYDAANFMGVQIDEPRIYYVADAGVYSFKLGYLKNGDNIHFGYLPEQTITSEIPYLRLTISLDKDADGHLVTKVYDVPMSGYNGEEFRDTFGLYILRNHIYTLSVDDVAVDTPLTVNLTVEDWVDSPFELDFSQTLVIPENYKLRFSNMDGTINNNTGEIIFKPWTTSADGVMTYTPIDCRFGIESPIGATWTAYLNTVEGEQDAFAFLDSDGNLQPHLTGTVDNKIVNFKVITQNSEPEILSKAKLQIYVRFADNTMMEADLTPESAKNFKNYTFVQNPL